MPAIPAFTPSVAPQPVAGPRLNPGAAAAPYQALAEASERVSATFTALAEKTAEARQVTAVSNAQTGAGHDLTSARIVVEQTPDLAQQREKLGLPAAADPAQDSQDAVWQHATLNIGQKHGAGLTGRAGGIFLAQFGKSVESGRLEMAQLGAKRAAEAGQASLDRNLTSLSSTYANARTELERLNAQAQAMAQIDAQLAAGAISAPKAQNLKDSWGGRLAQAEILRTGMANPAAGLAMIAAKDAQLRALNPTLPETMAQTLVSKMQANATAGMAAEARAGRLARQAADAALNGFTARVDAAQNGEAPMPTRRDLDAVRDLLSPGEYRAGLAMLREAGAPGNKPGDVLTYADLLAKVGKVPEDEFNRLAASAARTGAITRGELSGLMNTNRAEARRDGPPGPLDGGREFVRTTLDPGNVPMSTFLKQQLAGQLAAGVAEYDRWARANPQATGDEAVARARAISAAVRESSAPAMRDAMPLPYGFSGPRAQVTPEVVKESARRLLASGLPAAQIAEQAQRLEDWQQIIELIPPAAAKPRPGAPAAPPGRGSAATIAPRAKTE